MVNRKREFILNYDIVFVSQTGRMARPFYDPSSRYRAFTLAEYFRRKGKCVTFMAQNAFEKEAESFTSVPVIAFHRPGATEEMLRYVTRNQSRQTLVADYDDLVFDVAAVRQTPAVCDRGEDVTRIARSLAANAEIGALFKRRTASTVPLAQEADRILGGNTKVIHNSLDPIYSSIAQILTRGTTQRRPTFDLGYFSGTASHNRDFELIAPQIADYLAEDTGRTLLLFGPVALPNELEPFRDRITLRSVVSFYEMAIEIIGCRMVVAPLIDTIFTQCKSGLKFFEAGALGVSVAATPIPDIDRFESPLLHKCRTPEDWAAAFRAPVPTGEALEAAVARVTAEAQLDIQMDAWASEFLEL